MVLRWVESRRSHLTVRAVRNLLTRSTACAGLFYLAILVAGATRVESQRQSERDRMVETQIRARGIVDPAVLEAMATVPRHEFVPADQGYAAYDDRPLPIGHDQTISQPYIVALMTEMLDLVPGARVLEIGTGSGYQAAVLAEIGAQVFSIEIVAPLAAEAERRLRRLGYSGIQLRTGDGYEGWMEEAPFDAVLLTAAPAEVPEPLLDQLAIGGRLVAPVGGDRQELVVFDRVEDGWQRRSAGGVRFVPMTGRAQRPD